MATNQTAITATPVPPATPVLDVQVSITQFVEKLQTYLDEYYANNYPILTSPKIIVELGQSYAKIVRQDHTQSQRPASRSVHCFVALKDISTKAITAKTGDILKAASWKAPAKHPRGSVFNTNPLRGVGVYGAEYIR